MDKNQEPAEYIPKIIITGMNEPSFILTKQIYDKGIVGLDFVKHYCHEKGNVVSLSDYRERNARSKDQYDIAIIVVSEDTISTHIDDIKALRKQSGTVLAYVTDMPNNDFSKNKELRELSKYTDTVFPITDSDNCIDSIHCSLKSIIESFTVQSITGVDMIDINFLIQNAGMGITVNITVSDNEHIVKRSEETLSTGVIKPYLHRAGGVLISSSGSQVRMDDIQTVSEFVSKQNPNVVNISSLLMKQKPAVDGTRRTTIVFTGVF